METKKSGSINDPIVHGNINPSLRESFASQSSRNRNSVVSASNLDNSFDSSEEEADDQREVKNLIRGSSLARTCTATSAKRFLIIRRDLCGLLCQIVIPLILVLVGLWITSGPSKLKQSPPRNLSTGFYPYKQRILMSD